MVCPLIRLLRELQFRFVREKIRAPHFALQAVEYQLFLRPVENMQEDFARLRRNQAPGQFIRERTGRSSIDGLAVDLEPLTDLRQTLDARLRDDAFARWADVEQVVAAAT